MITDVNANMYRKCSLCPKTLIREESNQKSLNHDNQTIPCPKKIDRIYSNDQNCDIDSHVVGLQARFRSNQAYQENAYIMVPKPY